MSSPRRENAEVYLALCCAESAPEEARQRVQAARRLHRNFGHVYNNTAESPPCWGATGRLEVWCRGLFV